MAVKGSIWKKDGSFGISHDDAEPSAFPFATKEDAESERDRIHERNIRVEESTSGVGKQAEGPLHAEIYASIMHRG